MKIQYPNKIINTNSPVVAQISYRPAPLSPNTAPAGNIAGSNNLPTARSQTWPYACVLWESVHSSTLHGTLACQAMPVPRRGPKPFITK